MCLDEHGPNAPMLGIPLRLVVPCSNDLDYHGLENVGFQLKPIFKQVSSTSSHGESILVLEKIVLRCYM